MASDPRVCSGFVRSLISTNATLEGSFIGNSGNDRRIDNIEFTVSDIAARVSSMARPSAGLYGLRIHLLRVRRWAADRRLRQG